MLSFSNPSSKKYYGKMIDAPGLLEVETSCQKEKEELRSTKSGAGNDKRCCSI